MYNFKYRLIFWVVHENQLNTYKYIYIYNYVIDGTKFKVFRMMLHNSIKLNLIEEHEKLLEINCLNSIEHVVL